MGSTASQRFAEFRDDLPLKCQCGGVFVNMDKLNIHKENNIISYTNKFTKELVSFNIPYKKYQKKLLYVCADCGHAIWVGNYDGGGSQKGKAAF